MRFCTPSRPAISIAAKARYGLHDGSGQRNSTRLAFGLFEYSGMRQAAERLRCEYTRLTGASYPGTNRLYEFVVGAAKASTAGACVNRPPMYQRAMSDRPAYPASEKNSGSPPFHNDWWQCMPEPLSWKIGLGMNVADLPAAHATFFTTYL